MSDVVENNNSEKSEVKKKRGEKGMKSFEKRDIIYKRKGLAPTAPPPPPPNHKNYKNTEEENTMLNGRVYALIGFLKQKTDVKASDVLAILGYPEDK